MRRNATEKVDPAKTLAGKGSPPTSCDSIYAPPLTTIKFGSPRGSDLKTMPSPVLPILRSHSRNLITILKILSFFTKMHSPDCRNFTGPTQCKPPSARQQNVIGMAFSWRADVQGGGWGGGGRYSDIFTHT